LGLSWSGVTQFSPWTFSAAKNNSTIQITADTPDPSGINQAVPINWNCSAAASQAHLLLPGNDNDHRRRCEWEHLYSRQLAAGTCNLTLNHCRIKNTDRRLYTGDTNFNGNTDTEPHGVVQANVFVRDARAAEPAAGSTNMLFTVTLSTSVVWRCSSVNFTTNTGGATPATPGTCGAGGDYVTTSGTVKFCCGTTGPNYRGAYLR
jgi:hypothetical protein